VDAVVLPVAKAAKVEYKEREAGRAVSVAQKLVGDNFEVVISKIPKDVVKRILVEYVAPLEIESENWKHSLPFAIDRAHLTNPVQLRALIFGNELEPQATSDRGGSVVFTGSCDSQGLAVCVASGSERDSFLIRVPVANALKSLSQTDDPTNVQECLQTDDGTTESSALPTNVRRAILWDTSRSSKSHASAFMAAVANLLDKPNTLWTCVAFDFSARVIAKDVVASDNTSLLAALAKERLVE
jgi:hypothetical protein